MSSSVSSFSARGQTARNSGSPSGSGVAAAVSVGSVAANSSRSAGAQSAGWSPFASPCSEPDRSASVAAWSS